MQPVATETATRVRAAIAAASARSGVDFGYLFNQAQAESGLRPDAQARTSSARGLYQFLDSSWLDAVRKHGAAAGVGWAAQALNGPVGRDLKAAVLALRDVPEIAASVAADHAADNGAALAAATGRTPGAADLYLAHFLGVGGAAKFIQALDSGSQVLGNMLFPEAAAANPSIFFDGSRPRSLGEIHDRFAAKFGEAAGSLPVVTTSAGPSTANAAARLAYLTLAALGG